MEWLLQPWPWYVAGPLIGLTVPLLLVLSGHSFGISSSLQHLGCLLFPNAKWEYIKNHDWRAHRWNLIFVIGVIVGAFIGSYVLSADPVTLLPENISGASGIVTLLFGGVLIGFGTRYADGCTSGHTIMGLSLLSWPSLVATIFFFIGGLLSTHLLVNWVMGG